MNIATSRETGSAVGLNRAIEELLKVHAGNEWFLKEYWPMNVPRVHRMVADVTSRVPAGSRILDVGCGTGYISYLFARLGYHVTAVDAWPLPERDQLFDTCGAQFLYCNLNLLDPFKTLRGADFDAILMGEVIEHILNCPLDLIRSAGLAARSDALMILTTPNPATAINAIRLLRNRNSTWGTEEFMRVPKIEDGKVTSAGEIHFREYTAEQLRVMMEEAGFKVIESSYMPVGPSGLQPAWKRFLKGRAFSKLLATRLFGASHYMLARKL